MFVFYGTEFCWSQYKMLIVFIAMQKVVCLWLWGWYVGNKQPGMVQDKMPVNSLNLVVLEWNISEAL